MRPELLHKFRDGNPNRPVIIVVGLPEPAQALLECLDETYSIWWLRLEGIYSPSVMRSFDELVESYKEQVLASGVRAVVLVGFSLGGLLAAGLAASLRDQITVHHSFIIEPPLPGKMLSSIKPKVRPTSKKSFIQRVSNHLKWRWLNVQSDARIANSLLSMFWIWTAFSDQLLILTKEYGLTRPFGPTSLIGSKEFLNLNGHTWEKLNAGESLEKCQIIANSHFTPMLRGYAQQWLSLVAKKLETCSGETSEYFDRPA